MTDCAAYLAMGEIYPHDLLWRFQYLVLVFAVTFATYFHLCFLNKAQGKVDIRWFVQQGLACSLRLPGKSVIMMGMSLTFIKYVPVYSES